MKSRRHVAIRKATRELWLSAKRKLDKELTDRGFVRKEIPNPSGSLSKAEIASLLRRGNNSFIQGADYGSPGGDFSVVTTLNENGAVTGRVTVGSRGTV